MMISIGLITISTLALNTDHPLEWMLGCWESSDKSAQEVWVLDHQDSLSGFAVSVKGGEVGFYEVLSITINDDGSMLYTAHPSGQASATFTATDVSDGSVVFSNPEHDYPQEIRYTREGNRLLATISLLDGVNPNTFEKEACQ